MLLLWGLWSVAQAQEVVCPDPEVQIQRMSDALLEARLEDAQATLDEIEDTLGCAGLPSREVLARLWMTEGVRLHLLGDDVGARGAFASSLRLATLDWPPEYGNTIFSIYASSSDLPGEGELLLRGVPDGVSSALDGEPAVFPLMTPAGAHLVQLQSSDGAVLLTRYVMLPADEVIEIEVGDLSLPPPPSPPAVAAPSRPRRGVFLVGGGISALAAGGTYLLARGQSAAMADAASLQELDGAYRRQKVYAGATYGLAGLSAVGVGLYLVR